jgi:penicillin-binding protein 2
LVKQIVEVVSGTARAPAAAEPLPPLEIKPEHLAVIRNALIGVNREGTSSSAFAGAGYVSAGKTGTAQVVTIKQNEKYNASKMAEHLRDHALFMAYAPAMEPTIAVALVVENAGFGGEAAAPIARRVFDFVINGTYPSEADVAVTRIGKATAPVGTPRLAASVMLPGAAASQPAVTAEIASAPAAGASAPVVSHASPAWTHRRSR